VAQASRPGLTAEQKREMWSRWKAGQSFSEIGRVLGKERSAIRRTVASTGGYGPQQRRRSLRVLSSAEREEISRGLAEGLSLRTIARRSGRAASTISREIARHGGPTAIARSAPTSGPGSGPGGRSRASSPPTRTCASSSPPSSRSSGRPSRSPAGLPGPIPESTLSRCRRRRSTGACSSRPGACCARSSWSTCAPGARCAAHSTPPQRARAAAGSSTRCPSGSARPRPPIGRCPVTGRVTCWPDPPTATSPPSWSARPATCSSSRCPARAPHGWSMPWPPRSGPCPASCGPA